MAFAVLNHHCAAGIRALGFVRYVHIRTKIAALKFVYSIISKSLRVCCSQDIETLKNRHVGGCQRIRSILAISKCWAHSPSSCMTLQGWIVHRVKRCSLLSAENWYLTLLEPFAQHWMFAASTAPQLYALRDCSIVDTDIVGKEIKSYEL